MKKILILIIFLILPCMVNAKSNYQEEKLMFINSKTIALNTSEHTLTDVTDNVLPSNPKTGDEIAIIFIGVVIFLVGICVVVMLMKEE